VLTFDDGPWPTTPAVLKALSDECTKAIFFPVGKHTTYHPEILRQVFNAGHTVGSHTWSHAHLDGKKMTEPQVREEIEKGFSAVKMAIGAAPAPFFRFPGLGHKQGKGVILMHDLQKHTAIALPTLLRRLKAGGYKVVQMKAKEQLETLPEYDAMLVKDQKVPAVASRPISSVVQTVSQ
jgi:peptidoglycan/xylan/chitin deacetylase (PgdA/CDA1 family)